MCIVSLLHGKEAVDCKPPNAENQGHLGLRLQQTPRPCKNTSKLPSTKLTGLQRRNIRRMWLRCALRSLGEGNGFCSYQNRQHGPQYTDTIPYRFR